MKDFLMIGFLVFSIGVLGFRIGLWASEKMYIEEGKSRMMTELCQKQDYDFCNVKTKQLY